MRTVINQSNTKGESEEEYLQMIREYFLDPKGSNADYFLNNVINAASKITSFFTKKKIFNDDLEKIVASINHQINYDIITDRKKIINKVLEKSPDKIPESSKSLTSSIDDILDLVKHETRFDNRFIGQMHPHGNIPSYVAKIIAGFINGNTIAEEVSRVTTHLERIAINWLLESFNYNPDKKIYEEAGWNIENQERILDNNKIGGGIITSGGTLANIAAMTIARNKAFPGIAEKGIRSLNEEQGVIIGSDYMHYSFDKIAGLIGIGSENLIRIKTDTIRLTGEQVLEALIKADEKKQRVIAVIANAGTTETGTIDDIQGIEEAINEFKKITGYKPYFHVDAAHGGGFVLHEEFDPKRGGKFKGIEKADSITIDPHKMLYTQYPAGALLVKNKDDLSLIKQSAGYLFKNDGLFNMGERRIEGSMGLDGALMTYASLITIGRKNYEKILDHVLKVSKHFEELIRKDPFFEILHERDMNLITFKYVNEKFNEDLINIISRKAQKLMIERNKAYISNDILKLLKKSENNNSRLSNNTPYHKTDVFRAVIMHPYTSTRDAEYVYGELKNCLEIAEKKIISK